MNDIDDIELQGRSSVAASPACKGPSSAALVWPSSPARNLPASRTLCELRRLLHARLLLARLALVAFSGAIAACGSGSGTTPLPIGEGTPRAYSEAHLVENEGVLLRPQHLVVVHLEAAEHERPDSGDFGMDVLPYHIDAPLTVSLSIHQDAELVSHLVVKSESGKELARHARTQPPVTLTLSPGTNHIELHHARKGDASAPAQTVFLRLSDAPADLQVAPDSEALLAHEGKALAFGVVSTTCVGCDFSHSNQTGHDFTAAVLDHSNFFDAILASTNFSEAQCVQCNFSCDRCGDASGTLFTKANLQSARFDLRPFIEARFTGADLSGASLANIVCLRCDFSSLADRKTSLRDANLTNANFGYTFFENADLSGATIDRSHLDLDNRLRMPLPLAYFRGASLVDLKPNTYFIGKDLSNLDLSGSKWTGMDLSMVDLSKAVMTTPPDLTGAVLSNGWSGANLSGIRFASRTVLAGTDMRLVNLSGASLYQADLHGTNLGGAQLTGANLGYANLSEARLVGTQLGVAAGSGARAAQLSGAYMPNADLTDADLRSVDLSGVHLYGDRVQLVRTRLDAANLHGALLAGVAFSSASLNDASFDTAVLVNARFDNANLTNTKFNSAYLQGAVFEGAAAVQGVALTNAVVSLQAGAWTFTEQDGTPYTYGFQATSLGIIGTSASAGAFCPNSEMSPCTGSRLNPVANGPYPPQPACIPKPPRYDNCLKPTPP